MKYIANGTVDKTNHHWFGSQVIKAGTIVYKYTGQTYGCCGNGIPITLEEDKLPFIEIDQGYLCPIK